MERIIKTARGIEKADLVLKGGFVINVYTQEIVKADIAITDGVIAGVGEYSGEKEIDVGGKYVMPGFIDTHMHIESTMLTPAEYAKAVLPWGTTTAIADPHEIANVCGVKGVQYMMDEIASVPMDIKVMAPSCVPATPFENNGATLNADDIAGLLDGQAYGIGEFMDFTGIVGCSPDTLKKIEAGKSRGAVIDGHFPNATDKDLSAYIAAGVNTEHECTAVDDALRKISLGMYVQIREGSATRNARDLMPIVTDKTMRRCVFCTDDKHVEHLLSVGHINNNIKIAVEQGVDPIAAVTIATLNAAECYRLYDRGAIAPGKVADIVITDNLTTFKPIAVYKNGILQAENGKAKFEASAIACDAVRNTVHCDKVCAEDFRLNLTSDNVKVIKLIPENVLTERLDMRVKVENGEYVRSGSLAKICVVERHKNTGNIGIGLIEGYGIKEGAIASSVAHDSHNIIAIGVSDEDIALAVNTLREAGGGLVAVKDGEVLDMLALPIAGIMTDEPICEVQRKLKNLTDIAINKLCVSRGVEPYMSMSFLSLVVIPDIKITDRGLFDFNKFDFVKVEND